jgi:PAS domain S-box-containing protein
MKQLADIKHALDQSAIVATTDVSGRITYANDKFCAISQYSRQELLGQDHRIINSGLHPKSFFRDMWQTIARGQVWHGQFRNRAKDGHYYWVDTTIVPFLNDRGKPYQYISIRYDITERKAAEERLREQAALARVGQMAGVVAHEVKNPLAGIKGAMQIMMSRRPPGDPDLTVMGDIIQRIDALNELVQDLLVFSQAEALAPGAGRTASLAARYHRCAATGSDRGTRPGRHRRTGRVAHRRQRAAAVHVPQSADECRTGDGWPWDRSHSPHADGGWLPRRDPRYGTWHSGGPAGPTFRTVLHDESAWRRPWAADRPAHHRAAWGHDRGRVSARRWDSGQSHTPAASTSDVRRSFCLGWLTSAGGSGMNRRSGSTAARV